MADLLPASAMRPVAQADIVVIGGGACGLLAALVAAGAGVGVLVIERDPSPAGSTALSSGFIPAAGTRFQRAIGVDDNPALLAGDIRRKTRGLADPAEALRVATAAGPALEFLADRHFIPFEVIQGFLYPGHSRLRMHAVPERTGAALMARLAAAAEAASVPILTEARAGQLFADTDGRVHGVRIVRPDGRAEDVGCRALVLACSGYGGAPALVHEHIPAMASAPYFGHAGNQGDALRWGLALGADARNLSGYQGHGSVAHPHGALITWALMMEGGVQVNARGERFSDEHQGYSEQAAAVLAQPGGTVWCLYDARLHALGLQFEDYRGAHDAGAVRTAADTEALAAQTGLPLAALVATLGEMGNLAVQGGTDRFGRTFRTPPLAAPFYAVRVTGALFHTQGGLVVDDDARVLRPDGTPLPNLFAGGGAARGVSGPDASGYLSGNGLLTAIAYGWLAGHAAARLVATEAQA